MVDFLQRRPSLVEKPLIIFFRQRLTRSFPQKTIFTIKRLSSFPMLHGACNVTIKSGSKRISNSIACQNWIRLFPRTIIKKFSRNCGSVRFEFWSNIHQISPFVLEMQTSDVQHVWICTRPLDGTADLLFVQQIFCLYPDVVTVQFWLKCIFTVQKLWQLVVFCTCQILLKGLKSV